MVHAAKVPLFLEMAPRKDTFAEFEVYTVEMDMKHIVLSGKAGT